MSFISLKKNKKAVSEKKIPPKAAWRHYNKKQGLQDEDLKPKKSADPLISIKDISLSYENTTVISNLSLDICERDYLCVIGENGSGKSTLMNAILGLKKQSSGKIEFHGLKRTEIGVLPQQSPISKDFPALVSEVVISGCLNRASKGPFMSKDAKRIAFENMERLGITSLASRPYRDLSGGQQQRAALARALCSAEKILVLDEPVSGLDAKSTADIYSLIYDLNRKSGMTVVMVTHDIRAALKYSTKILRINKNSVFFGSVNEYKALPEAKVYLDVETNKKDTPYGEGGFRYNGGDVK